MTAVPRRIAVLVQQPDRSNSQIVWPTLLRKSDAFETVTYVLTDSSATKSVREWRTLTSEDTFDAVLLGDHSPDVLEAARELAARGLTLVIPVEASLPHEFVTELSLFDAEGESTLIPLLQSRLNPLLRQLRERIEAGELGTVSSIEMERTIRRGGASLLDPRSRRRRLLADVDSLRMLGGDYSQVTLLRTGNEEQPVAETLTLGGAGLPDATTITRLATGDPMYEFRVHGSDGVAVIRPAGGTHVLEINETVAATIDAKGGSRSWHTQLLDESLRGDPGAARWRDVARAFEIIDATDRSLRKRRTIDLHFETTSERSQFKTQMAAIGCGVILWTMFGIIGLLFAGAVLDPREQSQIQAESAGFVIPVEQFVDDSPQLTIAGGEYVEQITEQLGNTESVVIVESSDDGRSELDKRRREVVREALFASQAEDKEDRVVIRTVEGEWFTRAMQLGRVLVFAPVGVYLLMQALLLIAKPAAEGEKRRVESGERRAKSVSDQ